MHQVRSLKVVSKNKALTFDRRCHEHDIVESPLLSAIFEVNLRLHHLKSNLMSQSVSHVVKNMTVSPDYSPRVK